MLRNRKHASAALAAAFAVAILAFVGSTAYSQLVASRIDVAARSIADNAASSIRHLATARVELRHLEALVTRYAQSPSPELRRDILDAQHSVDQAFESYFAAPAFPGERALWAEINAETTAFDHAVARAMAEADAANGKTERGGVSDAIAEIANRAVDQISRAVDFNARAWQTLALGITRDRQRSTFVAAALDLVSIVLTLVLAWITIAANRRAADALARERAEAEARADELEQFAGRVAHDIRGPLSAAGLVLGTVKRKLPDEPASQGLVTRGLNSLGRANAILTGLLAFARAGARPGAGDRSDFGTVLEENVEALAPVAAAEQVSLRLESVTRAQVAANPGVLASVIENLIRNAIKYMEGTDRRIVVRAFDKGGVVRVEVEDTGPGIPPDLMPRIFQPHVRGHFDQGGIGIGLATVKRIVDAHGGTVEVRSVLGRGTTFTVELPVVTPTQPEAALH